MQSTLVSLVFCFAVSAAIAGPAPRVSTVITNSAVGFGWRPAPSALPGLGESYRERDRRRGTVRPDIPPRWDSLEHGWVTPVKNQGTKNTCWTFSTMAALETALKKAGVSDGGSDWDFSENHLAKHDVGFSYKYDSGGNNDIAAALLTSWRDPLRESEDPYPFPESSVTNPPARHVQNIIWLPERANPGARRKALDANDELYKRAVMEYGAVSVGYFHAARCFDSKRGSFFMPEYTSTYATSTDGGHAVALIGWDDDYPASNFKYAPPGNGAFLCKSSWGAGVGTNGCVWISYYDSALFMGRGAAYPAPERTDNHGYVYEYDPCGFITSWSYCDGSAPRKGNWGANVFTAVATGTVESVGFYALAADLEYEIRVHSGCSSGPSSGTLVCCQTGTVSHAGYVTVDLTNSVALTARGQRFSVAVHFDSVSCGLSIPVEGFEKNYCYPTSSRDESFLSADGEVWTDFKDVSGADGTENVCIKAYTRYESGGGITPRDIYVDAASVAAEPDGTEEKPYVTISEAIRHAASGDSILVKPGVYRESVSVTAGLKAIRSTDGAAVTMIDGEHTRYCYDGSANGQAVLEGFTLANGSAADCGGGAYYGTLSRCIVSNCEAVADKSQYDPFSGMYYVSASGGGVSDSFCDNCLIVGNRVRPVDGSEDFCFASGGGASRCRLVNCTVVDNRVTGSRSCGGGVSYSDAFNSIIAFNSLSGTEMEGEDVYCLTDCTRVFSGGDPGFRDRARGDYRLSSDSQCIDAGWLEAFSDVDVEVGTDLDGNPRLAGFDVDQGCYEYSQEVSFRDWTLYETYAAQSESVVIEAEGAWTLELASDLDWMTLSAYSGSGCATVTVFIAENRSDEYRVGTVYLRGAGADDIDWCDVVQSGVTVRENRHYGLFVGINSYYRGWKSPLDGCVNDAIQMQAQAVRSGLWHGTNTVMLTNRTATVAAIRKALSAFSAVAVPGDTVIYHHSGHGGCERGDPSRGYLCAYDSEYSEATLAEDLARFAAGVKVIVIADACHSGALFKDYAWSRAEHTMAERMSELIVGPAFIAAADYDQYSFEEDDVYASGSGGGAFTAALVEGWRTGAADADGDGKLNFLELVEYAGGIARGYRDGSVIEWTEACRWNDMLLATVLAGSIPGVWPETGITSGDTAEMKAEKVHDALIGAGFKESTASAVRTESAYAALIDWGSAQGKTMVEQASSATALLSAAMGAADFLELDEDDVKIEDFALEASDITLAVSVTGCDWTKIANTELLCAALGISGSDTLTGEYSSKGIPVVVTPSAESVTVSVRMPSAKSSWFLRVSVR